MGEPHQQPIPDPLTSRETEILRLISDGLTNRDIAQQLYLSLETVKWYNKQIYSKLHVNSRTQAVAVARQHGLLDSDAGADDAPHVPHHNLPVQITSFVGREREIADIKARLQETHLLTLTGPGGTGKTRLAMRVAADLAEAFTDGVVFVDLARITRPERVPDAIAEDLGIQPVAGQSVAETLKQVLAHRSLLLLLDNFEHVIQAAPLVTDLLSVSSGLRMMVTSRQSLQVYGEQEYPVPPMALPDLAHSLPVAELLESEAVSLFVQRARAVDAGFTISPDDAPAVAEICVRLDGLPLAIELAAARLKLFSPQALLGQLESRFTALGGDLRGLPDRQRTLRGAIAWSYDLLDDAEKALFARLPVFQGGYTIDAVDAVCAHDLAIPALDGVESLFYKSLLRQKKAARYEPRFTMLETIQEYARERLDESGEAEDLRARHAEYFTQLAEEAESHLRAARQDYWFDRLEAENENLRAALAWTLDHPDDTLAELGSRLVAALRDFWYYAGYSAQGVRWSEQAMSRNRDASPALRAKVLNAAGTQAYSQGIHDRGMAYHREALAIFRELGDTRQTAWTLCLLSFHYAIVGLDDYQEGLRISEEALALFEEVEDEQGIAQVLGSHGEMLRMAGDYEQARQYYQKSLEVSRKTGERQREAMMLHNMGFLAQIEGDYDRAETLFAEPLAIVWELAWHWGTVDSIAALAGAAAGKGQLERAATLIGASDALFEKMGAGPQPGDKEVYEDNAATVRAQMDEAAYETAWQAGRAMTLEQAVNYALRQSGTD